MDSNELLLITADNGLAEMIERQLSFWPMPLQRAHGIYELWDRDRSVISVILLDLDLPDSSNETAVCSCRKIFPSTPLIAIADVYDDELADKIFTCGATDFLIRREIGGSALRKSIRFSCLRTKTISEKNRQSLKILDDVALEARGLMCVTKR